MKNIVASIFLLLASVSASHAAVMWNYVETGGDVVGTFSGTLDLTGMTFGGTGVPGAVPSIGPATAFVFNHDGVSPIDLYFGLVNIPFGPGGITASSS